MKAPVAVTCLGVILVTFLFSGCASQSSRYGFLYGADSGIFSLSFGLNIAPMTQFTPNNVTYPTYFLDGSLDLISLAIFSASAAVNGSKLYTWGQIDLSARNSSATSYCPAALVRDFSPARIVSLESGDSFSLLVLDSGEVYTWGTGNRSIFGNASLSCAGMLGQPGTPMSSLALGRIDTSKMTLALGERVIKGVTNSWSSVLVTSLGRVFTFGANGQYGLGQPSSDPAFFMNVASPIDVSAAPAGTQVVSATSSTITFLLLNDGSFLCHGIALYMCNGSLDSPAVIPVPIRILPPTGVSFTRLLATGNTGFGWDQNGDVWFWGQSNIIPDSNKATACASPSLGNYICTPRLLEPPPNSGRVVDLGFVDGNSLFALTERNEVWVTGCNPPSSCSAPGSTWIKVDYPVPAGFVPDVSRSTMTGYLFVGSAKPLVPCTSPPPFDTEQFICSNGVWTLFSSAQLNSSTTYVIESQTSVRGNLTIGTSTTINIQPGPSTSITSGGQGIISVDGCLLIEPGVQINVNLTQQQLVSPPKGTVTVTLVDFNTRNCSPPSTDTLHLGISAPTSGPSCKKYKLGTPTVTQQGAKGQLNMVILIDSSKCNLWWIILASVMGGVLLIIIAVILLATFNHRVKSIIRPFWVRTGAKHRAEVS